MMNTRARAPSPDVPSALIGQVLAARDHGAATAFSGEGPDLATHARVQATARGFARAFVASGLRLGQIVGVQMAPSADRLAVLAALWSVGAVVLPLDAQLGQARRTLVLQGAGARLVVHDADFDISAPLMIPQVTTDDLRQAAAAAGPGGAEIRLSQVQADHPAALVYGGGAQDSTRGVVLDHRALLAAASGLAARYGIGPGVRLAVPLPLHHAVRLVAELLVLASGAAFAGAKDASHVIVSDHPDLAADAADAPDVILASGTGRTIRDLQRQFPAARVYNSHARAELSGIALCSDPRDPAHTAQSTVGRPLPGVEVMIVDPRSGMDMLLYEIGEIWIRGALVMQKYHDDPVATRKARDRSGFFRTGEMGYLDSEGRLVLCPEGHAQI